MLAVQYFRVFHGNSIQFRMVAVFPPIRRRFSVLICVVLLTLANCPPYLLRRSSIVVTGVVGSIGLFSLGYFIRFVGEQARTSSSNSVRVVVAAFGVAPARSSLSCVTCYSAVDRFSMHFRVVGTYSGFFTPCLLFDCICGTALSL